MENLKFVNTLRNETFIVLRTYRSTGEAVDTTVWFAQDIFRVYVFTFESSGKAKRIRGNSQVQIAASDRVGNVHGQWLDGTASVVIGEDEATGYQLLDAKYQLLQQTGASSYPVPGRVILAIDLIA